MDRLEVVAKVQTLTHELHEQWTSNHAEHCSSVDYDHDDGSECLWPLPKGLQC